MERNLVDFCCQNESCPHYGIRNKWNYINQTPAMTVGLATHIWTFVEWISFPARNTISAG